METIVIITIAYICAVTTVGLVAAVVVLRDVAASKRMRQFVAPTVVTVADPAPAPEAAKPEPKPEIVDAAVPAEDKPEADVNFSTDKLTLEEKYLKLDGDQRAYYDEIVRYAMAVEGHKRYKSAGYEEYKVGKNRLVRIRIKNDVIVCELMIPNFDLKNYVNDNKIDLRQSAIVIKVVDEASLNAVKGCIDIALGEIEKEREYKKEQAKIRRRERRAEAKSAASETEEVAPETEEATAEAAATVAPEADNE